ncbi:hypothetical protein K492DRAFT_176523 [Lichtheimia hyalospora FSU 10163]|nr:hypothetical protein K492DRAFT_176523 [Lichtheimia hyalospora FSU 10163]
MNVQTSPVSPSNKIPPRRKLTLTDESKHPHLAQIHEVLHNIKHDVKESYEQHRQEKQERRSKMPQDGKTNPME